MEKEQLRQISAQFGLTFQEITETIDTSHGEGDRRLNYILDKTWVLKINSRKSMWEERLQEIARLIDRYRYIGVYCPRLMPALQGGFSVPCDMNGVTYTCFVEEYAKYPICGDRVELDRGEIIAHMGALAAAYTNVDLSEIHSMWSMFDLTPLDADVDEKQENANALVQALKEAGEGKLANQVLAFNQKVRQEILTGFRALPRCVYQGDLNSANYLHKGGRFAGLIDFNMAGTDVNINVFVNETNDFPDDQRLDTLTVPEILAQMAGYQQKLLDLIWEAYTPNELELRLLPCFQKICNLFQWPNMCQLRVWLKDENRRDKALELIRALAS